MVELQVIEPVGSNLNAFAKMPAKARWPVLPSVYSTYLVIPKVATPAEGLWGSLLSSATPVGFGARVLPCPPLAFPQYPKVLGLNLRDDLGRCVSASAEHHRISDEKVMERRLLVLSAGQAFFLTYPIRQTSKGLDL
jgi:hypothetical protein